MKRFLAILMVLGLLSVSVSAQSAFTYVTDFDYAVIRNGGVNGTFVYGAYEDNGAVYKIGLLNEDGEQSRLAWNGEVWNALFEASVFTTTVHGDAGSLCPYAATHTEQTLCPYTDVSLVTLKNVQTGVALGPCYMYNPKKHFTSSGSLHMCFGNYVYTSPETLKWDGENTFAALCNDEGLWGVVDTKTGEMLTPYAYRGMSAVYGMYAKVYDGAAWGRLDLSGQTATVYTHGKESDFSVREELREIASGVWQVFDADNEPLSVTYTGTAQTLSYSSASHLVLETLTGGDKTLYDHEGNAVATFDKTQTVTHLARACYAIEQYNANGAVVGVALAVYTTDTMGDVNLDGKLNTVDARVILQYLIGNRNLTERQLATADVTGDGRVDSLDARMIMMNLV